MGTFMWTVEIKQRKLFSVITHTHIYMVYILFVIKIMFYLIPLLFTRKISCLSFFNNAIFLFIIDDSCFLNPLKILRPCVRVDM